MTKKNFLFLSAAVVATTVAGLAVVIANGVKNSSTAIKSKADPAQYSITFDANCTRQQTTSGNDYAYSTSSGGNKYAAFVDGTDAEHDDEDLFVVKGGSNYIRFAYGDIASDGSFTAANFNGGITSIQMTAMYTADNDFGNLYTRVYFNSTPTFVDDTSHRSGYTTLKDSYTTFAFDLSSKSDVNYIGIKGSNAFASFHIKSITINYSCNTAEPVTLDSLTISGAKSQYNKNETYSFDGTVTAHYSDSSSKDVTSSIVMTSSAPDMSVAGEKTVTYSYTESGITVYADYVFNVVEPVSLVTIEYYYYDYNTDDYGPAQHVDYENSFLPLSAPKGETIDITVVLTDGYVLLGVDEELEKAEVSFVGGDVWSVTLPNSYNSIILVFSMYKPAA